MLPVLRDNSLDCSVLLGPELIRVLLPLLGNLFLERENAVHLLSVRVSTGLSPTSVNEGYINQLAGGRVSPDTFVFLLARSYMLSLSFS